MDNMMPIHQLLCSLECCVIETVVLLLCGVTEHCVLHEDEVIARIKSTTFKQ